MADDDVDWREVFNIPEPGPGEHWGSDYLRLAKTLHERGDFKRALLKAVQAIDSWPTKPEPYVLAGDALSMIDEYDMGPLARADFGTRNGARVLCWG